MSDFCKALFFAGVQVDRYTGHSSRIGSKKDDESLGLADQQGRPGPHLPPEGATGLSYCHVGTACECTVMTIRVLTTPPASRRVVM